MSRRTPPSLEHLAMQNLLSHPALANSALDDLPMLLFPSLFMEAYTGGHREVLKAMVQAWPFPCLPLGDLAQSPDLDTFKAVLDGLDLLLAQKERPTHWKLQLLDLGKEHPEIWTRGYLAMAHISSPGFLTDKQTGSPCLGLTNQQPLLIAMDLTIQQDAQDDLQALLLQWAGEKKGRVQLCSRKLQILSGSVSEMQKALRVVRLDSIQELLASQIWRRESMDYFDPYLGQMKSLRLLKFSDMRGDSQSSSLTNCWYWSKLGVHMGQLQQLRELHVHDARFLHGQLPALFRSLRPLQALSLSSCDLQEADLSFLFHSTCARQLQHLRLRSLPRDSFSAEPLRLWLEQVSGTLESLALEHCYITDNQLSAILPSLGQCSQLSSFSFYGNTISMAALLNLLSLTAKLGHLKRGLYPAPLESYCPQRWWHRTIDAERFAQVQAGLVQTLRDMGTTQKVQICTNFCHVVNKCQFYSLEPSGSWVFREGVPPGLSDLPV